MTSRAFLVSAGFALLMVSGVDASSWRTPTNEYAYKTEGGQLIKPTVFEVDMRKDQLRVISVPFEAHSSPGSSELSLRDLGKVLAEQRKYRSRDWMLVNGGFSSYAVDVPLGLLVTEGRVYSTVTLEKNKESGKDASEFNQLRWGGILCQRKSEGPWEIIPATRYRPKMCWQAIQAGPVLVEPDSKVGIAVNEPKLKFPFKRTVICLPKEPTIKVVLTEQNTSLLSLARWLAKPKSAGGLGCRAAINLSGDTSSGAAIFSSRNKSIEFIGEGAFPIPSALIFEGRVQQ